MDGGLFDPIPGNGSNIESAGMQLRIAANGIGEGGESLQSTVRAVVGSGWIGDAANAFSNLTATLVTHHATAQSSLNEVGPALQAFVGFLEGAQATQQSGLALYEEGERLMESAHGKGAGATRAEAEAMMNEALAMGVSAWRDYDAARSNLLSALQSYAQAATQLGSTLLHEYLELVDQAVVSAEGNGQSLFSGLKHFLGNGLAASSGVLGAIDERAGSLFSEAQHMFSDAVRSADSDLRAGAEAIEGDVQAGLSEVHSLLPDVSEALGDAGNFLTSLSKDLGAVGVVCIVAGAVLVVADAVIPGTAAVGAVLIETGLTDEEISTDASIGASVAYGAKTGVDLADGASSNTVDTDLDETGDSVLSVAMSKAGDGVSDDLVDVADPSTSDLLSASDTLTYSSGSEGLGVSQVTLGFDDSGHMISTSSQYMLNTVGQQGISYSVSEIGTQALEPTVTATSLATSQILSTHQFSLGQLASDYASVPQETLAGLGSNVASPLASGTVLGDIVQPLGSLPSQVAAVTKVVGAVPPSIAREVQACVSGS